MSDEAGNKIVFSPEENKSHDVIKNLRRQIFDYEKAMELAMAQAGTPDAAEGCRLICHTLNNVLCTWRK